MAEIKILVKSPIHCKILKGLAEAKILLSYPVEIFRPGQYRTIIETKRKTIVKAGGMFYTGLLPKLCDKARVEGHTTTIEFNPAYKAVIEAVKPLKGTSLPQVPGFDSLRQIDQFPVLKRVLDSEPIRGVILQATGTGKTIIALSIIKSFEGYNILILCPNTQLVSQWHSELKRFNFKDICVLTGGDKNIYGKIVVSNVQTYIRQNLIELADYFDIVIVDEAHLAFSPNPQKTKSKKSTPNEGSSYEKILSKCLAPVRLGFTATMPTDQAKVLNIEGLLGPIISQITFDEAIDMGILSEPRVELICVPENRAISRLRSYKEEYQQGIVENKLRNRLIIEKVIQWANKGLTSIIFITRRDHGEILYSLAKDEGFLVEYVHGDTFQATRDEVKAKLNNLDIDLVVASVIWREGINIPTLGGIFIAGGGESEMALIQAAGRALRKVKGKDQAMIGDCLDIGPHLSQHSIARLQTYVKLGWI